MQAEYFIDDVIIDDKRIGPKCFAYINDEVPIATPMPPSNLTVYFNCELDCCRRTDSRRKKFTMTGLNRTLSFPI